jgi:hypothetical protein
MMGAKCDVKVVVILEQFVRIQSIGDDIYVKLCKVFVASCALLCILPANMHLLVIP